MFDFMIFVHLSFFCSDKNKVTIVFKSVGVVSNVRHEICFQDVTLNPNQMFFKWIILWIREKYTNQILKHFHIIFDIHLPRLFCFGFGPTSVCINFHFFVLSRWVKKKVVNIRTKNVLACFNRGDDSAVKRSEFRTHPHIEYLDRQNDIQFRRTDALTHKPSSAREKKEIKWTTEDK